MLHCVIRMRKQVLFLWFITAIKLTGSNGKFTSSYDVLELSNEWSKFKETFNKSYDVFTERIRKSRWEGNFLMVTKHNQEAGMGLHNYTLRANHLADLDVSEYVKEMIKLLRSLKLLADENMLGAPHHNPTEIPEEIDWRDKGYKTPVQNQESCGSCYAFAISSMIEAQVYKEKDVIKILSPQQLVDCSKVTGNMGCRGGSLRNTLQYIKQEGLAENAVYPYSAKEKTCHYKKNDEAVKINSWAILPAKDEYALKVAVAVVGPIAVSINASPSTFQLYHDGIYDDIGCSSDKVNHAMLLIGYTKNAWILKNWWSESWGQKGYMHLRRGRNQCGIANYAAYVQL